MADLKLEGAELKKMVKLGKKRPLYYAFCPGPKNAHTLLIDRRKGPEMLGKLARQVGEGNKVAFGTFEVKGRVMEMTCVRTVPQMAKLLKKYLKTQKTLVNVVILDVDGNTLDSDVEDLPPDPSMDETEGGATGAVAEDQTGQAPPEAAETQSDAAALAARLKALQPAIAAANEDAGEKLKKVMAGAVAQIRSSAFEQADKSITALETAVAKLAQAVRPDTDAPPIEPDFRALAVRAKALQGSIAGIAEPARGKLMTALSGAVQQIKARNHDAADTVLSRIETAVNKTLAAVADAPKKDGPDIEPQTLVRLREVWMETRAHIRKEIEDLKSAIDTATRNVVGLEEVPARSKVLYEYVGEIDTDLERTLQALADENDDKARETLRASALQIVETYKKVLNSDFFRAVDNNGFVKTDIRGTALNSLQQVSAALAA